MQGGGSGGDPPRSSTPGRDRGRSSGKAAAGTQQTQGAQPQAQLTKRSAERAPGVTASEGGSPAAKQAANRREADATMAMENQSAALQAQPQQVAAGPPTSTLRALGGPAASSFLDALQRPADAYLRHDSPRSDGRSLATEVRQHLSAHRTPHMLFRLHMLVIA